MQNFQDIFPEIYTLLTAWFSDDGNDEKVVKEFVTEESKEMINKVLKEGKTLLSGDSKYREKIGDLANRSFDSQKQSEEWLFDILSSIEKNVA
ncbi:contact-dependent growth inhibition system immunity protein [Candidatus Uabimicrobium sp. HlEnr_7]|uniref:contact-dependent growth inhibition system immunity protein n=1 Tax=Candidatus Uabimicrobium helgolandensis TaxID=3095367 RepID=UPI003558A40A